MQIDQFTNIQKIVAGEILAIDESEKYRFDHSFIRLDEVKRDCIPFIAPTQSVLNAAVERKHRKQKKTDEPTKKIKGKFDDGLRAEARRNEVGRLLEGHEKMIVLDSTIDSYIEWRQKNTFTRANLRGKVQCSGHNHDKLEIAKKEMRLQQKKMKGMYSVMICATSAVRASIDNLPPQLTLEMSAKFKKTRDTAKNRSCLPEAYTRITHSQTDGTPDMHFIAYFKSKEKADKYYKAFQEAYNLGRTSMQEVDEGIIDYLCRQRKRDSERELALLAWAWVWDVKLHSQSRDDNRGIFEKIKDGKKHSNRHRQYRTTDLNITKELNSILVGELDLKNATTEEWFCLSDFYIDDGDELGSKLKTTEATPSIVINTKQTSAREPIEPIEPVELPPPPVTRPAAMPPTTPRKRMTRRELVRSLTRYAGDPAALCLPSGLQSKPIIKPASFASAAESAPQPSLQSSSVVRQVTP